LICRIFTGFTTGNFGDDLNRVNITVGLVIVFLTNAMPKEDESIKKPLKGGAFG
jgi:hypothetical protein